MMEDSGDVRASPKRIKKSRWGPVTENDSPIKKLEGTEKVISNGTENVSPTSYSSPLVDDVNETPKPAKITKISKTVKADQLKEQSKSPQIEKPTEEKITSSCESPTTSHLQDGFCGFDDTTLSKYDTRLTKLKKLISSERENCGGVYITVERINVDENNSEAEEDIRREEDMTVHTGHVSESDTTDRDSNQMEIDIDKNSSPKSDDTELNVIEDKGDDRTKETDVDVDVEVIELEKDPVKESGVKPSRRNKRDMTNKTATIDDKNSSILENTLKGGNVNVEYCGVCESEVDDAEEGICCDGNCGRWFHLRCSGLTQIEYDELGLDENAKWACSKCSGKAPPVLRADAKPLLSVRKDLSKTPLPPSTLKRRSTAKEGSPRTPKLDISNPAFLKPFDFGWKRELVYRSTNENHNNRRQGDIYYYTPKGKKLRSLREISDHLIGSDLTPDNFTFWKEPLGIDDPAKEIIRDAKLKIANRDSSVTPNVPKKVTPKIIKSAKVTPKLTATVTPMDTVNSKMESPVATTSTPNATPSSKALASITPRVVFKNKTTSSSSTGPKFKVTPSKNSVPGQPPRVTITKGNEKRTDNRNTSREQFINSYRNYEAVIADPRGSLSNDIETGNEIKKKNNFRRYGLLANAKSPRKSVNHAPIVTLSSSDDDDDDNDRIPRNIQDKLTALGLTIMGERPKLKQPKAVHFCLSEENNKKEIIHPLSKAVYNNSRSPGQVPSKNKQRSPEIQFRPCNPSSYGCQTSPKPHTSVRPASISDMSSSSLYCTNVYEPDFERVLIVDTTCPTSGNYISPPKHRESPLFLKDKDSSLSISNVKSLISDDRVSKFDPSYIVTSPAKQAHTNITGPLMRIKENRRNEPDLSSDVYSPVSVGSSSSPEDIIVVEEELEDNNMLSFYTPPPKLTRVVLSSNKLSPSIGLLKSPPPLVPCPAREIIPLLTRQNFVEHYPGTSQASNNVQEQRMDTSNKDSLHNEYRKFKQERLYKKIKAQIRREKLKKNCVKQIALAKKMQLKYYKLKTELEEKKIKKIKKKEMKSSLMLNKLVEH